MNTKPNKSVPTNNNEDTNKNLNSKNLKKQIYETLRANQDKIEKVCDLFCTEKQKQEIVNSLLDERNFLPNTLTLSRIPGIILVYTSVLTKNPILIGSTILLISSTDALDGLVARNITKNPNAGGALLDCGTDKLYSLALIIPAISKEPIILLNGTLETIIAYINKKASNQDIENHSTMLGKIKMWPLSVITALTYINAAQNSGKISNIIKIGSILTAILECINIIQYSSSTIQNSTPNKTTKKEEIDALTKLKQELLERAETLTSNPGIQKKLGDLHEKSKNRN